MRVMHMPGRDRSRTGALTDLGSLMVSVYGGAPFHYVGPYAPVFLKSEQMHDYTSPYPYTDNPMVLTKRTNTKPPRLDGQTSQNTAYQVFLYDNFCPLNMALIEEQYLPAPVLGFPAGFLLTQAIARINAQTPKVDLPLFLFEFKDFPSMLRNLGDILNGKSPADLFPYGYLAYQFGWAPLRHDILSLLATGKSIDDRIRKFRERRDGGKVGGSLGSETLIHDSGSNWGFELSPNGQYLTGILTDSEESRSWYSAKLSPDPTFNLSPEAERWAAIQSLLGLNVSASTLWNMLPWSFLIDYFLNIGDFLDATRGGINFHIKSICLMCTETRTRTLTFSSGSVDGVTGTSGVASVTRKSRGVPTLAAPVIVPTPFLSKVQILNMGALITAGALRRFR